MTAADPLSSRHETICAAPACANTVLRQPRGRPALYCSPACRSTASRARRRTASQPVTVEIDHGSTSAKQRPAGRIWLVRLRRGHHTVIVATGLGRPSADHLASQLTQLLTAPPTTTHTID